MAVFRVTFTVLCLVAIVYGAGWCPGIERGEGCGPEYARSVEAQTLHLQPGEKQRDAVWGAGMIEQTLDVDVLVAGGGSAGTSAALAAARSGASVVLANGRPVLGGNSGSEVRLAMVGACGPRSGSGNENALELECREGGIVEEYQLDNTVNNPDLVPELFSLELLTLVKAEPNLTLFQNTWLVGVTKTNGSTADSPGTITSGILEDQQSQRRYIVRAKTYIDATGDGRLGVEAGAEWIQGREGASKYNESLARMGFYRTPGDGPDHETEGTSLDYMAEDKNQPTEFRPPFWAAKFNKSQFQYRGVTGTRPYGYWWNEISWPYNTITDGENVTNEALADILGIWDYLKNSGDHPESSHMGLTWFGNVPCKREGRRFVGQYVQSQNDIMKVDRLCTRLPPYCPPKKANETPTGPFQEPELYFDRVAYAGWPFDLHNPKGMRDPDHPPFTSHKMPYMYSTPLRSLVSKDLTNLFFAGRLASFSHVVYGSQRVMKTCATMGQAAGTAAAYAVSHGIDPIALKDNPSAVWSIQQQLIRDDAYIIGLYNEDPRDYARNVSVSATSEQPNGAAKNILSGQSRAVVTVNSKNVSIGAGGGVPASQGINGTNRWMSVGLPASVTLSMQSFVPIKQVQLTFDTGMHRKLAYSVVFPTNNPASNWGPQPETVRDYFIEGEVSPGKWEVLCNVTGNYQRRRVHTLPCPPPEHPEPPAPVKPTVANGSVSAANCNVTSLQQRWTLSPADAQNTSAGLYVRSADGKLCLSYDTTISAYGGHGNSVVARPCETVPSGLALWQWSEKVGGSLLRTLHSRDTCSGYPGEKMACECVHPVACAACHGTNEYTPPTSVELYMCSSGSYMQDWSALSVNDGRKTNSTTDVMLMVGGLCLQAPQAPTIEEHVHNKPAPPRQQRVQPKSTKDIIMENTPAPPVQQIRVTVTATNGIEDARINEIRLYDAQGIAPFPTKPQ
eukprot:m.342960 g.342960  ORF g.342960 m.342960 type:complete len:959 (-) comp22149_c0_seq1:157-3033(-)